MNPLYINIISYFEGYTGYNIHAREFANGLEKIAVTENLKILKTNCTNEQELIQHQQLLNQVQNEVLIINICISYGNQCWNYLQLFPGVKIGCTFWESTKLPDDWIKELNKCDYVWAVSQWKKQVLIENGINSRKIYVIPSGVDSSIFNPNQSQDLRLFKKKGFKFFTVGKCEHRKSTRELIMAFDLEFHKEKDVYLVLATDNPFIPNFNMPAFVNNLWLRNYEKFIYIPRGGSHVDMAQLMNACDCGVFPTKAEGWGLPIIESMALGKPTIVTNYSAVTEYANQDNAILLDYYTIPIQDVDGLSFYRSDNDYGTWALPNTTSLRKKMRMVYENYDYFQQKFLATSDDIRKNWSWEAAAQKAWQFIQKLDR